MALKLAVGPLVCGFAALMFGLLPGLLEQLMQGIENFAQSFQPTASRVPRRIPAIAQSQRNWFVLVGAALVVLGLFVSMNP